MRNRLEGGGRGVCGTCKTEGASCPGSPGWETMAAQTPATSPLTSETDSCVEVCSAKTGKTAYAKSACGRQAERGRGHSLVQIAGKQLTLPSLSGVARVKVDPQLDEPLMEPTSPWMISALNRIKDRRITALDDVGLYVCTDKPTRFFPTPGDAPLFMGMSG